MPHCLVISFAIEQLLPTEYGGRNTTPVQDSAEERHLRRLVDAVNANASGGRDRKHGTPSHQSNRTPTRRHKERFTSPSRRRRLSPRERVSEPMDDGDGDGDGDYRSSNRT